ncbi:DNA polymerase III, subunits gamma and tau [Streptomyces albus]|uniref:DNA polymerase III subunit gamma/tau n=1 Tax=Streptomyces albus (strain ATCC 21838 / DSM 41398 / FERM P-419 / JCM 4703 / NBRC 107858) TaxID=1081613 RepID=A0A0B5ENP5_STRA4|nr:DNA polymerase III, subunits gamma and tau [Streptomyces albus]AOU78596.1 DNA polymerase III, subunits gamma and tau [Streptomyces albus]
MGAYNLVDVSSLALYRRYRPESFAEVIGQEHVTDPLQQALRNNRVNHAYLFSGPRGCGKTTSARILARCLNCEQGPTPTPCGECQSCRDLARTGPGSIDVIEIDAASHGGVDDARELREKAFFGPASSRYKIYIIDEAHMVTSAGFNALLKVVEEPPEHLKFIFATTEPEKVIGTIRSRTHHYPFRLVPPGTLREYLGEVCGREQIPVEDGVLPLVVRAGAGSVRDSMSVMDQLLAGAAADGVTYAMATALLGYTDGTLLDSVVEAFAAGDGAAAFEVVDQVIEGGNDPRRFVADLLERLRDLVILAAVPDAAEKGLIDAPADVLERMQAQAGVFGAAELSRAADLVNEGLTEMRGATAPRLQLELICARVLLPAAYDDQRALLARLDRLERGGGVHFVPGNQGPPMAYAPGPGAHPPMQAGPGPAQGAAPGPAAGGAVPPGGGPAAARAAVRGGVPEGGDGGSGYGPGPGPGAGHGPGQSPEGRPSGGHPADEGAAAAPGVGADAASAPTPASPPSPSSPSSPSAASAPSAGAAPAEGTDSGTRAPGAWPGAAGAAGSAGAQGAPAGAGGGGERRPGGWPTAATAGGGQIPGRSAGPSAAPPAPGAGTPSASNAQSSPSQSAPSGPSAPSQHAPAEPAPAHSAPGGGGGLDPRVLWPNILEAVKNRRRFTWILLSQNAQVAGFDGTTLQLGFVNAGARDNFASSGSEEVLRQALVEQFNVPWKVEAIVDPSGGSAPPSAAGGFGGGPTGGGAPGGGMSGGGSGGGYGGGAPGGGSSGQRPATSYSDSSPSASSSSPHSSSSSSSSSYSSSASAHSSGSSGASAAQAQGGGGYSSAHSSGGHTGAAHSSGAAGQAANASASGHPGSSYVAPEDDMPAEDDADLDATAALSGHDLIVRELGATVLEEIPHE